MTLRLTLVCTFLSMPLTGCIAGHLTQNDVASSSPNVPANTPSTSTNPTMSGPGTDPNQPYTCPMPTVNAHARDWARVNLGKTTLVTDIGTPLRGVRWSGDETPTAPDLNLLTSMRSLGLNTLHLYAEAFSSGSPPGYRMAETDAIVRMTAAAGMYLIITIGSLGQNGQFNLQYAQDFWNIYSGRYANETHVIYEIQNEPVAWTPGYPPPAMQFENTIYKIIRSKAPKTPILLFSYSVFLNGANVLQDIKNLDPTVDFSNAAIAFHGYAGPDPTRTTLQQVLQAGYPCVQTEFMEGGSGQQSPEETAIFEENAVSWASFVDLSQLSMPENFKTPIEQAKITWVPDSNNWPAPASPIPSCAVVNLASPDGSNMWQYDGASHAIQFNGAQKTLPAAQFQIVNLGSGEVALRSMLTGSFVDATLQSKSTQIGPSQTWAWRATPQGTVMLQAANGGWVSHDGSFNKTTFPATDANAQWAVSPVP